MKIISIESILEMVTPVHIIEHRRIVTPFFYKKIAPKNYKFFPKSYGYWLGIKIIFDPKWKLIDKNGYGCWIKDEKQIQLKEFASFHSENVRNVVNIK